MGDRYQNPIDELVESLSTAFKSAKTEQGQLTDEEVNAIQIVIATGILSIRGTVTLISERFLPSVRKEITLTKNNIAKSKYRKYLQEASIQTEELHYETIRMGYVFAFHKYEVFVNEVLTLFDKISDNEPQSLEKYIKNKFSYSPKEWHKNLVTHVVSFIANCTKHHGGKCRLKDTRYSKPFRYNNLSDEDFVKPSLKEFKEDIDSLINSFTLLLHIITACNMLRTFENTMSDKEDEFTLLINDQLKVINNSIFTLIREYTY